MQVSQVLQQLVGLCGFALFAQPVNLPKNALFLARTIGANVFQALVLLEFILSNLLTRRKGAGGVVGSALRLNQGSGCGQLLAQQVVNRDVVILGDACKIHLGLLLASNITFSLSAAQVVNLVHGLGFGLLQLKLTHAQALLLLQLLSIGAGRQLRIPAQN